MPYKDPEYQKKYQANYQPSYQRERYARRSAELEAMLGGECVKCGATDDLHFHHRDPSTKKFSIMRQWTKPIEFLKSELEKCDLLCGECHRAHHYQ